MKILADDAPVCGVFVLLDGVRTEYPRADTWVMCNGNLSIRRQITRFLFQEFALYGRFDRVERMSATTDSASRAHAFGG